MLSAVAADGHPRFRVQYERTDGIPSIVFLRNRGNETFYVLDNNNKLLINCVVSPTSHLDWASRVICNSVLFPFELRIPHPSA